MEYCESNRECAQYREEAGNYSKAMMEEECRANALQQQLADAQATIAALQARVQELEQWVQDQSTANLEKMQHMDEMQSRALEAESQLTQRTAELEAATRRATNAQWQVDFLLSEAKKAFGLTDEYTPTDLVDCVLRPAASMLKERDALKAELERVRGTVTLLQEDRGALERQVITPLREKKERYEREALQLRALVLALLKVEGEIGNAWLILQRYGPELTALLRERQRMKGGEGELR